MRSLFVLLLALCLAPTPASASEDAASSALNDVIGLYNEAHERVLRGESFVRDGIGRAQPVMIAGEAGVRIVHESTKVAFVFLDPDRVIPESPELRLYLAQQHMDSGRAELVPMRGRDVVYVWMKSQRVAATEEHPRHASMSSGWWQDWKLATLRKPDAGDLVIGTACGVVYGGLATCVAAVIHQMDPSQPFLWGPPAFISAWNAVTGIYSKAYHAMIARGPPSDQLRRQTVASLIVNYSITILSNGWTHLLTIHDPSSQLAHLHTLAMVRLSSYISFDLRAIPDIREQMGLSNEPIKVGLPNGRELELDRYRVERNFVGLTAFPFGTFDQMAGGVPMAGGGFELPIGKLTLLASIPLLRRMALRYAEENAGENPVVAHVYRDRWENWLPVRMWRGLGDLSRSAYSLTPDECGRFLMPRDR